MVHEESLGDRSVGLGVYVAVWVHLKYLVLMGNVSPTKFPEIPVSLERNTEVFRHPLL